GKQIRFIARRALAALAAHDWPGNVRELAHALQSAVMLADHDRIDIHTLPEQIGRGRAALVSSEGSAEKLPATAETAGAEAAAVVDPAPGDESLLLDEVIKRTLVRSLEETEGNRRRAADLLGISRSTLYRMLARYSLAEEETGRPQPRASRDTD
ncbi:MAG: helix-turn-helix domain-containing protein, partial [Candidatus Binataceae bacterium]